MPGERAEAAPVETQVVDGVARPEKAAGDGLGVQEGAVHAAHGISRKSGVPGYGTTIVTCSVLAQPLRSSQLARRTVFSISASPSQG
jgi:hypothetical protein